MKSDSGNLQNKEKQDILNKIPIFLAKTFRIVDNPQYKQIIGWTPDGDSFAVKNITRLTTQVFPQHFKHNNFLSFIRQLNMYGFHKLVTNTDQEGAIFHHDYFKRDDLSKLPQIKRKNAGEESATNNENQNQLVPVSNREERLQKEVLLLRSQHEELQSMMEVLMEQNKTITAQNKAFLNVMGDMREKYRKKLQTLMLLFFFGKKNKSDGEFLFPPHFNNVIQAFEEMNIANPHMYPKKKKQQPLMITENGEHPFFDADKSEMASHIDKEESEDIFKVLEPLKSKRSVGHGEEEEKVEQDDHSECEWKDGIPISPFSVRSRPEKNKKDTEQWDEYWNKMENSDYSELELEKHQ